MPLHASQMKTHANESQKRSLDEQLARGMTPQEVSNKIRNDKLQNAPRHQPAFPAAVEDDSVDELPPLR
eukprot:scaffold26732_cov65-Phaeocystis_antarctica.AAC.3